ncbi:sugar phosphorylase [Reinekea sp.]|jgi:sucrose phosphorylase|uniref:sugar phosphorylase n=1 Tax=Reinekea sp. TaxID=1970455 RepID=UPI003989DAB0
MVSESALTNIINHQLSVIYGGIEIQYSLQCLGEKVLAAMRLEGLEVAPEPYSNNWSEKDSILITYGDSIEQSNDKKTLEPPLETLNRFLNTRVKDSFSSVHVLPFYPYSSDDGFSVINYVSVNESLGGWEHISSLSERYKVMADLVINHCSSRSVWFDQFLKNKPPGNRYFKTSDPDNDLSKVVRPRTNDLLRETETEAGVKYVWCTFSHDQVDFDFSNPDVLLEFVKIIRLYLDKGISIFRLDAVAFLWKQEGTDCINLKQTHEVIRLLRTIIEHASPDAVIITETNIPTQQNLSYFGNANEAHCIYNFSLPPLLVNTLVNGDCSYLKQWLMSMPPSQEGTAYFNFIASHDGIGLRPVEGLLSDTELNQLIGTMKRFGGLISMRANADGSSTPYEINIALFDALQGTHKGPDKWQLHRYLCAHAIMFSLEGIPGVYIHSLLGTQNDYLRVENTSRNRSINRHRWNEAELLERLAEPHSHHSKVFNGLTRLLKIRSKQKAFHPNATQFTLQLGSNLFGFWRQSKDRKQSIFCIYNITDVDRTVALSELNLIQSQDWTDLIAGKAIENINGYLSLAPYQGVWLSN